MKNYSKKLSLDLLQVNRTIKTKHQAISTLAVLLTTRIDTCGQLIQLSLYYLYILV